MRASKKIRIMFFKIEKRESITFPDYDSCVQYEITIGNQKFNLWEQELMEFNTFIAQYIDMFRHDLGLDEEEEYSAVLWKGIKCLL